MRTLLPAGLILLTVLCLVPEQLSALGQTKNAEKQRYKEKGKRSSRQSEKDGSRRRKSEERPAGKEKAKSKSWKERSQKGRRLNTSSAPARPPVSFSGLRNLDRILQPELDLMGRLTGLSPEQVQGVRVSIEPAIYTELRRIDQERTPTLSDKFYEVLVAKVRTVVDNPKQLAPYTEDLKGRERLRRLAGAMTVQTAIDQIVGLRTDQQSSFKKCAEELARLRLAGSISRGAIPARNKSLANALDADQLRTLAAFESSTSNRSRQMDQRTARLTEQLAGIVASQTEFFRRELQLSDDETANFKTEGMKLVEPLARRKLELARKRSDTLDQDEKAIQSTGTPWLIHLNDQWHQTVRKCVPKSKQAGFDQIVERRRHEDVLAKSWMMASNLGIQWRLTAEQMKSVQQLLLQSALTKWYAPGPQQWNTAVAELEPNALRKAVGEESWPQVREQLVSARLRRR